MPATRLSIVRIYIAPGHIDIDFDACFENGYLDLDDDGYSSGEMIAAVQRAVRAKNSLLTKTGALVLITGTVHAYAVL